MRYALLFAILVLPFSMRGQERARPDINEELWLSISVSDRPSFLKGLLGKDIVKQLRTKGELGYRSADSFFAGKQVYLDVGASYKASKHLEFGSDFRYAFRPEGDRQRIRFNGEYDTDIDRMKLKYRLTYQHNFRPFGEAREIFRHKFSADYNIRKFKLDPQFSVEFFQWAGYQGLTYFGTRYKLGTEWSPSKGHSIGFSIMHDRERAVYAPTYRFMFAFDYSINLRKT